jgi:HlyD family secretion protein
MAAKLSPLHAVALVLALGATACGGAKKPTEAEKKEAAAKAEAASPYVAIAAGRADIEGGLVDIAARQPGIVKEVLVREGDEVKKDEVLARLDDKEARLARNRAAATLQQASAQLASLETALAAAKRDVVRQETLAAQELVSPQRIENARDAVRTAQSAMDVQQAAISQSRAALAQADFTVEQHIVRAPDNGRIVRRYANPGSGASTLQVTPMFQLQPRMPRIIRAEVEERSLREVKVGMAVEIVPEADQTKSFPGSVLRIADVFGARKLQSDEPSRQTDERVVEVVVDAEKAQVLVGQRVLVKFIKAGATVPAAPAASVTN